MSRFCYELNMIFFLGGYFEILDSNSYLDSGSKYWRF